MARIEFEVNDKPAAVESPPERTLLEVLREDLHFTGTKYGCGEGACGACTILLDDRPAHGCTITIEEVRGKRVTTIEGLSADDSLHAVQEAFLARLRHGSRKLTSLARRSTKDC